MSTQLVYQHPQSVRTLLKDKGFKQVQVETQAGAAALFPDEQYAAVGATIVSKEDVFNSDIILKGGHSVSLA